MGSHHGCCSFTYLQNSFRLLSRIGFSGCRIKKANWGRRTGSELESVCKFVHFFFLSIYSASVRGSLFIRLFHSVLLHVWLTLASAPAFSAAPPGSARGLGSFPDQLPQRHLRGSPPGKLSNSFVPNRGRIAVIRVFPSSQPHSLPFSCSHLRQTRQRCVLQTATG
jgi:hypothetical protein